MVSLTDPEFILNVLEGAGLLFAIYSLRHQDKRDDSDELKKNSRDAALLAASDLKNALQEIKDSLADLNTRTVKLETKMTILMNFLTNDLSKMLRGKDRDSD